VAHAELALGGFADGGEGFGQEVVEAFAFGEAGAELDGLIGQLGVGQGLVGWLVGGDLLDDLVERLDVAIIGGAEEGLGDAAEHGDSDSAGDRGGREAARGALAGVGNASVSATALF